MSAHTPGPWALESEVRDTEHGSDFVITEGDGGLTLATCHESQTSVRDEEVSAANARLIAAAPDLLEAIGEARDVLDACARYFLGNGPQPEADVVADAILVVYAAIAKASG